MQTLSPLLSDGSKIFVSLLGDKITVGGLSDYYFVIEQ